MNKPILELGVYDFFTDIFRGSYVCAMKGDEGQREGCIPNDLVTNSKDMNDLFEQKFFKLNKEGWGIHFTPNEMGKVEEKNRKTNCTGINSWFIDLDIEETKNVDTQDLLDLRAKKKEEILTYIFSLEVWPSMTVETRNGFHLYWWVNEIVSLGVWKEVQQSLIDKFKYFGADENCLNESLMLRVPYFRYNKHGEVGQIIILPYLSTAKRYFLSEMVKTFPPRPKEDIKINHEEHNRPVVMRNGQTLIDKLFDYPIKNFLEQLSGTAMVGGDQLDFVSTGGGKFNILVNKNISPNWIDVNKNMVFSNTESGFCNIMHYLKWYGHAPKDIIQYFKDNVLRIS